MEMSGQSHDTARILLIDGDHANLSRFSAHLEAAGHRVVSAGNAEQGEALLQNGVCDLCFFALPREHGGNAEETLSALRQAAPWMRLVVVAPADEVEAALEATHSGATDYLIEPCSPRQLCLAAEKQIHARRVEDRLGELEPDNTILDAEDMDSECPAVKRVLQTLRQVADTDATVLLLGESGTGKGTSARTIHHYSPRAAHNFVTVNCPSLSSELLESELFGHKRGAFTGATENKRGRVDEADRGTLFLDEIGDVPLDLQPKLLRFVEHHEYESIGDPVTRRADVRVVAATNHDLDELVKQGRFREDLLYRLNVITVRLPPLRERAEDIPSLAERFLRRYTGSYRRPARDFTEDAIEAMRCYAWPGNIRELQNVIERAVILGNDEHLGAEALSLPEGIEYSRRARAGDPISLAELARAHILNVTANSASYELAAHTLGIDVSTLYRKRKEYGLIDSEGA
jgi:NtrC-family two-component system response regulator AlgB